MLNIDMLPAEYGDCLWIEYADPRAPKKILVDGGTHATYEVLRQRIETLPASQRHFELLIITHIDNDHIEGALRLLRNSKLGVTFKDVWFNGWKHLPSQADELGVLQAEYVSALIETNQLPWNKTFFGDAVVVGQEGAIPRVPLDGGLEIVLLSPTAGKLSRLRGKWNDVVTKAGLVPGATREAMDALEQDRRYQDDALGEVEPDISVLANRPFKKDRSVANGGSIAFLAEYEGRRCLFAGDAHADAMDDSLRRYMQQEKLQTLHLDAFKLSHHGSKGNLSSDLLDLIRCERYLVSTNGRRFHHPDSEAIARILVHSGKETELIFNYNSEESQAWRNRALIRRYNYLTRYPASDQEGIRVKL